MKLAIITGITGKLGEAYLDYFKEQKNIQCIGFSRKNPKKKFENVRYILANLLDKEKIFDELNKINLTVYEEVLFIHPIGMFKFEYTKKPEQDKNKDGIDDEIFSSNVLTFTNIFDFLKKELRKIKKTTLTVCAFGSITDKYNIPYWNSYTKSKNFLRRIIKNSISKNKNLKIRGVFVNVSTTDTGNERILRKYGNRNYWLSPKEIVDSSIKTIEKRNKKYTEINIYKHNPKFNPTWYTNHDNVLERWEKEMGLKI